MGTMRLAILGQVVALMLPTLGVLAAGSPLPNPMWAWTNNHEPSQPYDPYLTHDHSATVSAQNEYGLSATPPSLLYETTQLGEHSPHPFSNYDSRDLSQHHIDTLHHPAAWNVPLEDAADLGGFTAWDPPQHFHTSTENGELTHTTSFYDADQHITANPVGLHEQNLQDYDDPAAENNKRKYGTLEDIVGTAIRSSTSAHPYVQVYDDRRTRMLDDSEVAALQSSSPSSASTSVSAFVKNRYNTKSMADTFPGNVRGIVVAGRPGFRKGGDRSNFFETRDTDDWHDFINTVYFNKRLEWIQMSEDESLKLRYIARKSKVQFVLPSANEGLPTLRIHRHLAKSSSIAALTHANTIDPQSSIISVWSEPARISSKKGVATKERYVTFFHGLGQIKVKDRLSVIEHLETFIANRPQAKYIKF